MLVCVSYSLISSRPNSPPGWSQRIRDTESTLEFSAQGFKPDMNQKPDFSSQNFLEQHIQDTLAFYETRVYDDVGHFLNTSATMARHTTRILAIG